MTEMVGEHRLTCYTYQCVGQAKVRRLLILGEKRNRNLGAV